MLPSTRFSLVLLGLLLVGMPLPARAQDRASAQAPSGEIPLVLKDYQSFWDLPDAARQQRYRIDYEARILFYDPGWGILWLENQGLSFFCAPGKTPWPMRTGQRVRVEGTVYPPRGYEIEGLHFTALGMAPPPPPLTFAGPDDLEAVSEHRTRVRGYVEHTTEMDAAHVKLRLLANGYAIDAIVLLTDGEPVPLFTGSIVDAVGLLIQKMDPAGKPQSIDLWINAPADVEQVGTLAADPRFLKPIVSSAQLQSAPSSSDLVHVAGVVRASTPGQSITLWDDTGEITVLSEQDARLQPGDHIEAVGIPERKGTALHLRCALWRIEGNTEGNTPAPLLKLRRAAQVLELSPEEAARQHTVDLFGVVTWSSPAAPYFYVQDSTRGVCVRSQGPWQREPPAIGSSIHIEGHTGMGSFAPLMEFGHYALIGGLSLPDPREISFDQMLGGAEEGKLIALLGYLRNVEPAGQWSRLHLTSPNGEFTALLPASPELGRLTGSVLRLQGVCTAQANARRQLTGIELLVASAAEITVAEPAPADPFAVPAVSLAGLRLFGPAQTPYRRIRTSGRVNYHSPGRLLVIEDGDVGLEVRARDPQTLAPGATVEVVGFPGREGSRLVLREAVFRLLPSVPGSGPRPPRPVPAELRPEMHNRLACTEGQLLGQVRLGDQHQLTLQTGAGSFTVLVPGTVALPSLPAGSELRCTGVYQIISDEYGQPRTFQLLARTDSDLLVVHTPAWLNRGRALVLALLLALGAGIAVAWSLLLRRQVRSQTEQIRRQLDQQTALERELQKAAKLESLGLLAGGIAHDFNNLLTVILGNITLARLDEQVEATAGDCLGDAQRGAERARDLTQQLLTFAKGGDPLRTSVSLSEIVREATEFVLRGSKVACHFDLGTNLPAAEVDRGQIGQVVHNLVLNAVQAMPEGGTMLITLHRVDVTTASPLPLTTGTYLMLTVADTGTGMSPEVLARIFDPYFTTKKAGNGLGLATVYSIVRRHNGHIEAQSARDRGTTFHLWLPAGAAAPAAPVVPAPHSLPSSLSGRRILVMDDEADIRRLVTSLLHRMGMEVVATADGGEAVEAYRAALACARPFDLAIMDLTVPGGMGGKDAMDALITLNPDVRAIVSSGYSSDPVMADFRAFGFCGMVRKPYDIEELAACIAKILGDTCAPDAS